MNVAVIRLKSLTQNRASMKHDRESLAYALNATTETLSEFDTEIFRFSDSRLRYEMHLQPNSGTALLAADPAEPIQGCPMLEFSFRCTDILVGSSAYSDTEDEGGNPILPGRCFYSWSSANVDLDPHRILVYLGKCKHPTLRQIRRITIRCTQSRTCACFSMFRFIVPAR